MRAERFRLLDCRFSQCQVKSCANMYLALEPVNSHTKGWIGADLNENKQLLACASTYNAIDPMVPRIPKAAIQPKFEIADL